MGMTITFIAQLAYFIPMGSRDNREGSGNPIVFLLMLVLAPIASALIQMTISRSREYFADEAGAQICGRPAWLARALEKLAHGVAETPLHGNPATSHMFIVKPFSGGISGLFSTHPPIEERIMRLREMAGLAQ
jgi:heat shock protein HtpX